MSTSAKPEEGNWRKAVWRTSANVKPNSDEQIIIVIDFLRGYGIIFIEIFSQLNRKTMELRDYSDI